MKAAATAIRDAGRGMKGAAAVLGHEMIGLEQGLRTAGLHVERWLHAGEMAALVRIAYDYASTVQPGDPGANLAHAGPLAVDEHCEKNGILEDVERGACREAAFTYYRAVADWGNAAFWADKPRAGCAVAK